jgi:hypothetical protein
MYDSIMELDELIPSLKRDNSECCPLILTCVDTQFGIFSSFLAVEVQCGIYWG